MRMGGRLEPKPDEFLGAEAFFIEDRTTVPKFLIPRKTEGNSTVNNCPVTRLFAEQFALSVILSVRRNFDGFPHGT